MSALAKALAEFQKNLKPVKKSADNPFFKSKYADYSSVWDAVIPGLTSQGICVINATKFENDKFVLETKLALGEESVTSTFPILNVKGDAPGFGSALSYARRYNLQTLTGLPTADEDDDGEHSVGRGGNNVQNNQGLSKAPQRLDSFKKDDVHVPVAKSFTSGAPLKEPLATSKSEVTFPKGGLKR